MLSPWEWDPKVRWVAVILAAALLVGGGILYGKASGKGEVPVVITGEESQDQAPDSSQEKEPEFIVVHISGAVERPGVYRLPRGARVHEALDQAGVLPEADPHALNLAATLQDGQKIYVPRRGEALPVLTGGWGGVQKGGGGKVNINTASEQELQALPGIGPALARRIIEYRQQKPFRSVEDIKNVRGIGPKKFEEIKDKITVN